ncbi:response regulator transcription factor [Vibrio sp. LaRot3]|uniref:response regulator transcription factor n=1 Tax=Vibrio sp. LaRot3 TaxID=2998829 RepID=UPI0022CDC4BB|nr:response regulator transcription factor [Vibrio sp. LaRot3]MDA0148207.1 response regulator transcription factor [Vibrio sp. LaRot3]
MFDTQSHGKNGVNVFIDPQRSQTSTSILLVEDDPALNHQLSSLLCSQHYQVTSLDCGEKALNVLSDHHFDLVLLDINLPKVDGFEILNVIRGRTKTPVVMLTAYGAEEHRIKGLRYGADDYISKPCNFEEVSLRIEAVLRRTQQASNVTPSSRYLSHQELTLDRHQHTVTVNNEESSQDVVLTPIQFKLLWTLVQNSGQVQSKPYLYQAVLERDFSPYDRALDMHLSRIRKTLTSLGMSQDRIKTVHGKGYLVK